MEIYYCKTVGCPLPPHLKDFEPDIGLLKDAMRVIRANSQDYIPAELQIKIEDVQTPGDLIRASAKIIGAVTAGVISHSLGQKIQNMLNQHISLVENTKVQVMVEELKVAHEDIKLLHQTLTSGGITSSAMGGVPKLIDLEPEPEPEYDPEDIFNRELKFCHISGGKKDA